MAGAQGGHCGTQTAIGSLLPAGVEVDVTALLLGNPNVGKSSLFNRLTGLDVMTAHYQGKGPGVNAGTTVLGDVRIAVVDPPGVYRLAEATEGGWVTRETLDEVAPDVIVVVADEGNLERNLPLTLEALETGLPCVVALNLHDEALRAGRAVDSAALTEALGVPVVPTDASRGVGVEEVADVAVSAAQRSAVPSREVRYGEWVEAAVATVESAVARLETSPCGLSRRGLALRLIEGDETLEARIRGEQGGGTVALAVSQARGALEEAVGEPAVTALARARQDAALEIVRGIGVRRPGGRPSLARRLLEVTTATVTGVPLMLAVLLAVFGLLFFVGGALSTAFSSAWGATMSPLIGGIAHRLLGETIAADLVVWGLDRGIEASLSIGLPYILTFYVLLAVLEDCGYLGSVAFLADRAMHRLGLHGRAVVPLVAAAGCNVPAVLAASSLGSPKERHIAATLATMVPCSAQTAVILGAVAAYVGWAPAAGVFLVSLLLTGIAGSLMNRMGKGYTGGLVMEMFPFRKPALKGVLRKAWAHFREFLTVATPIVIVSSVLLGLAYDTGWIWRLAGPMSPVVVGLLGLPSVAGLTLLAGLVRKELALQLLVALAIAQMGAGARDLASFMTPTDIFVYALVNTVAFPCVSTVTVLTHAVGWKRAVVTLLATITLAVALGAAFARLLPALGWR